MAEGEVVGECFGVTDLEIIRAIKESSVRSIEEITNFTKAGGGCGKCEEKLRKILHDTVSGKSEIAIPQITPKRMTALQKIKKIEEVLEREIRPGLKKDGGDIELIDVDGDFVIVSLRGACKSCNKSQTTIKEYVEKKLRELVLASLIVEESNS
jgi:NifU-like protein